MENSASETSEGENKENNNVICEKDGDKSQTLKCDTLIVSDTMKENVPNTESVTENGINEELSASIINFVVVYNKVKYDVTFDSNKTIKELKNHIQTLIGVPQSLQKVMIKGLAKDEQTLKDLDVKSGAKVMVVGSKLDQILAVSSGVWKKDIVGEKVSSVSKVPFCKQKMHKKVLDKGKPDDIMVGIKNTKDPVPSFPLTGMLNKNGGKVRLTFKLEVDQLWISTKERTDKVTMNTIKCIVSEPIEGNEEYHIMGIQLGTTEASRYWVYWIPAQYVESIKSTVLGTWMP